MIALQTSPYPAQTKDAADTTSFDEALQACEESVSRRRAWRLIPGPGVPF